MASSFKSIVATASPFSTHTDTKPHGPFHTRFVQNFILVWLDTNLDEGSNNDCCSTIIQLQSVINAVKAFADADRCIDFLTDRQEEKVFIILCASLAERIVPLIHEIAQLDSIYILSKNKPEYDYSSHQWTKVKGVFGDIPLICKKLKEAAHQLDQNAMSLSFMPASGTTSNQKLNQLDQSFMYTQILKEILLTIDFDKTHIKDFASFCREQYTDNDRQLDLINKLEKEYCRHTPIWWYTYEYLLYSMVNRALRTMEVDIIIKMGFFLRDLHCHIDELHGEQFSGGQQSQSFVAYRGQGLSKVDFDQMMKTKGGLMSFNNFLSTSKEQDVSIAFAESNQGDPDLIGVFFEITVDPCIPSTPFALINNVSYYETEDEILFSMHTIFRIDNITEMGSNNRLWRVKLSLTNDNDQDLHTLIETITEETQGPTGWDRLGLLLIKLNQFKKAEEVYKTLFNRTLNDTEKADFYHMMGVVKVGQGEYEEAVLFYQKSFEINKKILPPNDGKLAKSYINFAGVYDTMGDYAKALALYEIGLNIYQQTLAPNHADFAFVYSNIGQVYQNMGQYPTALSYYEKDLEISQKTLPSNHPHLATSYSTIGGVYGKMGEYSRALSFHEKSLEIYQKTLPPNHPNLAFCHSYIGSMNSSMGQYSKALSSYEKALDICQKSPSSHHLELAAVYSDIGQVYGNMGENSKAISFYEKAFDIDQQTLPKNHPNFVTAYSNIGGEYFKLGKLSKAISYYEKAFEVSQKSLPSNHPNLAVLNGSLGTVYDQMGEYSKALSFHEKALEIHQQALPSNHPYIGKAYGNIGHTCENMGDFRKALSFYEKGLEIYQKTLPLDHPHLAAAYSHVGSMYSSVNEYSKALWSYEKQLEICQKILPSNHSHLAVVCNNIGQLYGTMGEYSKALSFHQRAVLIGQRSLPANHPNLQVYKNNLEFIRHKL